MRLKADGQNIDTGKGAVIAVTKTANSLEDAQAFQSSYTNQISIPATRGNALVLGNIGGLDSRGTEYLATPIDIESDSGLPVIIQGLFLIDTHEGQEIKGNIVSGIVDFFEQLGDLLINDLDLSAYEHTRNLTNVVAGATNTYVDGYVYALANFGNITGTATTFDVRQLYPSFYVKKLMELIASQFTDYTINDTFYFADAFFEKLALPFVNNGDYFGDFSFDYFGNYGFEEQTEGETYIVKYSTNTSNPNVIANDSFDGEYFTAPRRISSLDVFFTFELEVLVAGLISVDIRIVSNLQGVLASGNISESFVGVDILTISATVDLVEGEQIYTELEVITNTPSGFGTAHEFGTTVPNLDFATTLDIRSILPEMKCSDLFKSVWRLLGIQPQVDNVAKTITFRGFQEYSTTIAGALSLSDKIDTLSNIKIEYVYGSYGKLNILKFKEDDTLLNPQFADGTIAISNENLPIDYDMIELDFAPTASVTTANGELLICDLPILDGSGVITNELEPRICYIDIFTGTRIDIDFTDGTSTNTSVQYSLTKFVDPTNTDNLSFNSNVLTQRFAQFSLMIQKMQKVTARFKLSDLEFLNLDFFKLVHLAYSSGFIQLNGFYLIQEVKEYKGDDTVELELINVNIE